MTEARIRNDDAMGALSVLVNMVNKHGTELSVTLLVQGRTISGILTANGRFRTWAEGLLKGAVAGKTRLSVEQTPSLSPEESEAVREDWKKFERSIRESYTGEEAEELLDQVYSQCCLRDVKVYGMTAVLQQTQVTERYPYLMVKMTSVAALTLGIYEATKETKAADG